MDKGILNDYIDACALVKETEEDICKIKKRCKTIFQEVVKGSMSDFPYVAQNFHVEGIAYSAIETPGNLEVEERLLEERKANAEKIKIQVEAWMNTIPLRMQRIIKYKIFEENTWGETALKIGRKATADSLKMEFRRFMEKE